MRKFFLQMAPILLALLRAECSPIDQCVRMPFLSESEAASFFERFLRNHGGEDFLFYVELEPFAKQRDSIAKNGAILHRRIGGVSNYYIEISDGGKFPRKFLLKNGEILTNFTGDFDKNEPFIAGTLYSPNDLLLPFLSPGNFKYCGPKKVCGRVTQQFTVTVGDDLPMGIKLVKISVDAAFFQALEIEYLGEGQRVVRRQRVLSLRKNQSSWLPKTLELFDAATRERSKITVVDSACDQELADFSLEPDFCFRNSPLILD
jgi:hypothetical protein